MYDVFIKPTALKEIDRLHPPIKAKTVETIDGLKIEPRPRGCIKLKARENRWRIRVGNYRILYEIEDTVKIVRVSRVAHRKEVYR